MRIRLPLYWLIAFTFCMRSVSIAQDVSPAQPIISGPTISLTDFGASPDGTSDNTQAFLRAIAAVEKAGGGTLVVPAGRWLTGPIDLCSRLKLQIDDGATILFSTNTDLYRDAGGKFRPLFRASKAKDILVCGKGTIDGQGQAWWGDALKFKAEARAKGAKNDTSPRPNLVGFERCQRIRVEGITLTNSPKFNLVPSLCEDVTIEGITITNPHDSPNTDGIDPSLTKRMVISKCRIDTGDDCIAIKSGGKAGEGVRDLLITDCTFLHGHGCSFGSEMSGTVKNVIVRRCTFDGTTIGVRFKSDRSRGGLVEDVVYTDLVMKNVGQAIVITSYYPERTTPKAGEHVEFKEMTPTTPIWRKILIRNLTATACTRDAGSILGLPESPVSEVVLENVKIEAPAGLRIGYAKSITLRGVKITATKGEDFLVEDTVENLKKVD